MSPKSKVQGQLPVASCQLPVLNLQPSICTRQSTIHNANVRNPPAPSVGGQSQQRGFSLLDLLIALLVLTVVLLAAVNQFGSYKQPAVQSAPQAESAPAQP